MLRMTRVLLLCLSAVVVTTPAAAESKAGVRLSGDRIILIAPLTGSGTYADPRRPLIAPTLSEMSDKSRQLQYSWVPSDDGRFAIVDISSNGAKAGGKTWRRNCANCEKTTN